MSQCSPPARQYGTSMRPDLYCATSASSQLSSMLCRIISRATSFDLPTCEVVTASTVGEKTAPTCAHGENLARWPARRRSHSRRRLHVHSMASIWRGNACPCARFPRFSCTAGSMVSNGTDNCDLLQLCYTESYGTSNTSVRVGPVRGILPRSKHDRAYCAVLHCGFSCRATFRC